MLGTALADKRYGCGLESRYRLVAGKSRAAVVKRRLRSSHCNTELAPTLPAVHGQAVQWRTPPRFTSGWFAIFLCDISVLPFGVGSQRPSTNSCKLSPQRRSTKVASRRTETAERGA